MSDDPLDKSRLQAEFADSTPLDNRPWRHLIEEGGTVRFELLGKDGSQSRFLADTSTMSQLSASIFELARLSRHIKDGRNPAHFKPSHLPFQIPLHQDGLTAPFIGSMLKIDRAVMHFEALIDLSERYSDATEMTVHEVGFEEPHVIWEARFSQQPPAAIPLMIGDVVHNLRSALDLMVCDLARLQGLSIAEVKFPFAKDADTLEKILRKDHIKLGTSVMDAIRALKPFKGEGGNKLLRGLHDLDVIDKHRLIIPAFLVAWQRHNKALLLQDELRAQKPNDKIPTVTSLGETTFRHVGDEGGDNIVISGPNFFDTVSIRHGDQLRAKRGEDPLRYFSKHENGITPRFPMRHSPFPGDEVIPMLDALIQMVFEILKDFASKFDPSYPKA